MPLGKSLKVKSRSQGKYDIIIPLAKALVQGNHVEVVAEQLNYKNILRKHVKINTKIDELLNMWLCFAELTLTVYTYCARTCNTFSCV